MTITLITGATDGIGRETARQLLALGHDLILHGRNPERLKATHDALAKAFPNATIRTAQADFASLESVRQMVQEMGEALSGTAIDVLLNNAGIYANDGEITVDGFESTIAINHLAPFLLTHLLLPSLTLRARVINVSSVAHTRGRMDPRTWQSLSGFDPYGAYAQSKLANVMFTAELAKRLPAGMTSYALHPGVVSTKLLTEGFRMRGSDSLATGAETSVFLATAADVGAPSGAYFVRKKPSRAHALASDAKATRDMYLKSAELTHLDPIEPIVG